MTKFKYWTSKRIREKEATYNIVIGERSNGKTYAILSEIIHNFVQSTKQGAIVRRWGDDFKGKRGQTMFDGLVSNDVIKKETNGEWTGVYYYRSAWYFCRYEDDKRIVHETPFAYAFAVTAMEHDKSTSYPNITTIMFDEFITRGMYLPNEFVLFMNVVSTIVRLRTDVKIFMLGNTVNQYCPYFDEMGLYRVKDMKQGEIDVYEYGDSGLRVAVEFCDSGSKSKKESNYYFAFDNPKLEMITGGVWEMELYPHCPYKYTPKEIIFTYFIVFDEQKFQCEVVLAENKYFTYIHRKTTDLKDVEHDLIYSLEYDPRPNWRRNICKPLTEYEKKVYWFFQAEKVFYQDNSVGEAIRNYLQVCGKNVI